MDRRGQFERGEASSRDSEISILVPLRARSDSRVDAKTNAAYRDIGDVLFQRVSHWRQTKKR